MHVRREVEAGRLRAAALAGCVRALAGAARGPVRLGKKEKKASERHERRMKAKESGQRQNTGRRTVEWRQNIGRIQAKPVENWARQNTGRTPAERRQTTLASVATWTRRGQNAAQMVSVGSASAHTRRQVTG